MIRPLCIILPQTNGYIKYFENGGKNMSFLIKNDDKNMKKYDIWEVIKNKLGIKFHSQPIYENKYLKVKVREFNGDIKANFLCNGLPKKTCITLALLVYLEECKYEVKKNIYTKIYKH